ncbi:MAG: CmcI family methyltransferase [Gammaproteobacteria bacterium]|nr:CmcI family methyltransferase [Gammaproteobacteria bacterium]
MNSPFKTLSRIIRAPFNKRAAFKRLTQYHSEQHSLEEVVLRAMDFGGGGFYRVKTMQIPQEITALAKAVSELKPKTILEIGTSRAGTLLIWASIASERVITCDIQDMNCARKDFSNH